MPDLLSKEGFEKASDFLLHSARGLERAIYNYRFRGETSNKILTELKHYQNPDGGFGHGLGPDLRCPLSTPIATTQAFQKLAELDRSEVPPGLVREGIGYFEESFNTEQNRWFSARKEVNDYPHAPWWHYDEELAGTVIDQSWGNPTAEIIGYLLVYDEFVEKTDAEKLLKQAFRKLNNSKEYDSEHEIYCYLRLYRALPSRFSEKIREQLTAAVRNLVRSEASEWTSYVPTPLDFVKSPKEYRFGIDDGLLDANLNYLVEQLETNGTIEPTWEWGQYEEDWESAKQEWTGILTLEALTLLEEFDRIRD